MRRDGTTAVIATIVALVLLLIVIALAGLRSPTRTAELGTRLADDPAVQQLAIDALVDELLADADRRLGPTAPLLLPRLRSGVELLVTTVVTSPAGRAALASALTDTIRQLTVRGPTVIDLEAAAMAALDEAPPELADVLRVLTAGRQLGRIVLGAERSDEHGDDAMLDPALDVRPGTIAGVPSTAVVLIALVFAIALLVVTGLRAGGSSLLVVGAPVAALLWVTPEMVTPLLDLDPGGQGGFLADLGPLVTSGLTLLLTPVRWAATAMAGTGATLVGVSYLAPDLLRRQSGDGDRGGRR
jgi:hypothetical protein